MPCGGMVLMVVQRSPSVLLMARSSRRPIGATAADFKGFGAGQLAYPSLNQDSGWGTSLDFEELMMVARTKGAAANTIAADYGHASQNSETTAQDLRALRPIVFHALSAAGCEKMCTAREWPSAQGDTLMGRSLP
eukprot:COSAG03_NODE_37_length_17551_cov_15.651444_13_plen_135_part_00